MARETPLQQAVMTAPSRLGREEFVARFGGVFEHSAWIAEGAWDGGLDGAADSVGGLVAAMEKVMRMAGPARQLALVRAHPDLTGKLAVSGTLTAESTAEQASAGLDHCTPAEFQQFQTYNDLYWQKFDFPFVMAVTGSSRGEILEAFERRLENSPEAELQTALAEIVKIAQIRIAALFAAEE
ncbi:MAG: 2-oxo-4-hydroxy-4-carboxy-5-ureidoimidazoline decarboxylase [Alphaproteobacteria bacterium]